MRYRTLISSIAGAGIVAAVLVGCTGTPDTTYGTGGIEVLSQRGAAQIKMLPDGKLMVSSFNTMSPQEGLNLERLNPNGSPDPTYGANGKATNFHAGITTFAPDGRAYFIEGTPQPSATPLRLTALTAAGKPDLAFGSVQLPNTVDSTTQITNLTVAPGGDIYISSCDISLANLTNCQVLRYLPSGQRDNGFIYGGSGQSATVEAIGAGGQVYVGSNTGCAKPYLGGSTVCSLQKLNANGTVDAAFGRSGRLTLPPGFQLFDVGSVALDQSNRITMNATSIRPLGEYVLRYTASGKPDLSFGQNGRAAMPADVGDGAIAIDSLGRIVASSGNGGFPSPIRVYRFTTTGALDKTFGINGMAGISGVHGTEIIAYVVNGLALDSADRILLGLAVSPIWHDTDGTTAVVRLTS